MSKNKESLELVRGSGNVFADFGLASAVGEQVKARLAAEIIKAMDAREINASQAAEITRVAASDFSRIRHAKLDRFTIDRLLAILERLDNTVDVRVSVRAGSKSTAQAAATR